MSVNGENGFSASYMWDFALYDYWTLVGNMKHAAAKTKVEKCFREDFWHVQMAAVDINT